MKLVDHCPNFCLSSRAEVNDKWTGSGGNSQKNRFWKKFLDVFNCKSKLDDNCEPSTHSFHRRTTSNVHKCQIERKFKIKKRELFNRHRRELFVVDDDYNKSRSGKSNKLWKKSSKTHCRAWKLTGAKVRVISEFSGQTIHFALSTLIIVGVLKYRIYYTNNYSTYERFKLQIWIFAISIFHLTELIKLRELLSRLYHLNKSN